MDPMHQHMVRQVQQIGELERETERLGNLLRQVRHELRMREINRNLHERHKRRVQELMLEIEVASLQAQRPYLKPWEQRQITEAIDALHEGNRYPDCAPITRLMQEI